MFLLVQRSLPLPFKTRAFWSAKANSCLYCTVWPTGSHYALLSAAVSWGTHSPFVAHPADFALLTQTLSDSSEFQLQFPSSLQVTQCRLHLITFSYPSYNYFKLESFINLLGIYLLVFSSLLSTGYFILSLLLDTLLCVDNPNVTLGKSLAIVTFLATSPF